MLTTSRRSRKACASTWPRSRRSPNNPEAPTFENTYVAMEKSGAMLNRVMAAFNAVTGANTNDALQKVQEDVAPQAGRA